MSEAAVPSSFTISFISEITEYVTKVAWRVEGRFDTHESCLLFASTSTYTTRSLLKNFASAEQCLFVCLYHTGDHPLLRDPGTFPALMSSSYLVAYVAD